MTRSILIALSALATLWSLEARATPPPTSSASATPIAAPAPSAVPATSHEATPAVPVKANERSTDPARIQGFERREVKSGDATREIATALLSPEREFLELQFGASEAAARLADALRFAPRADDFFSAKEGEAKILPTFFFETRHPVSFGARIIALGPAGEASFALASGGPNDVFAQAHLIIAVRKSAHLLLEGMYDSRNNLEFLGVGQVPDNDPRNVFRPGVIHDSFYLERRSRLIASLDTPIGHGFTVVPSSSILLSRVEDAADSGPTGLSQVFEPTALIKGGEATRVVYSELALRFSTRRSWVSRDPGAQLEGYAGYGTGSGVGGEEIRYVGAGGRAVLFVPVVRRSNTFSPKVVLDAMVPVDGTELPFTVLVRQFEYRGFDLRRDKLSLIASLDYRWVLSHYIAARLFVDGATVAPRFGELFVNAPRIAAGFGFDIFSYKTDLVRFAFSGSADGVRVLLGLGPAPASGDRQHRN